MATVAILRASSGLRSTSQRLATLCAVLLAAVLLNAAPVAAQGGDDPGLEPSSLDPAAAYLMDKYQISEAGALRRLDLQDRVGHLLDDYAETFGEGYGGLWLDQAAGGIAVVGALPGQEQSLRGIAAGRGVDPVVVPVQRSIAQLRALQAELLASLPDDSGLQVGGLHDPTNQVEVLLEETTDGARFSPDHRAAVLAQLAENHPGQLRFRSAEGQPMTAACVHVNGTITSLGATWCDPPLRGGVGISAADAFYSAGPVRCSAGFNVRSQLDGKPYLLTAGHCRSSDVFQTRFTDGGVHDIGNRHNSVWSSSGDAMIIRIDNPSGWQAPRPYVLVTNGARTTWNQFYRIEASGTTAVDMVVCMTGRRSGSECGEVISRDRPGVRVAHVAEVRGGCIRGGDSGGPVFKRGIAYGIVHGGTFPDGNSNFCSNTWWYEGVRGAMDLMNVRLVTTSNL